MGQSLSGEQVRAFGRLAQWRLDLALPAIQRSLDEAQDPLARSRLLSACVEVMLEAGDIGAARAAAEQLVGIAAQFDAVYLNALAAHASGAVLPAKGDARAALTKLRAALRTWRKLKAPHQAARFRLLTGSRATRWVTRPALGSSSRGPRRA